MKKNTKKGFSIGEVLVAMFILLIGIVDAVFLTVRSIDNLGNSRDIVVATLLAQEGTELVRNVRDNTITEPNASRTPNPCTAERCTAFESIYGFPAFSGGGGWTGCTIDYRLNGDNLGGGLNCQTSSDGALYLNQSTGYYEHNTGAAFEQIKNLRRKVFIDYGYSNMPHTEKNRYADITSVVVFGAADFPSDINNIEKTCLKSKNCAYAQTRLTSWINYGE